MSADETKVGHGFVGKDALLCSKELFGRHGKFTCNRFRSAHPAEEPINWISRGQHERVALPDLVADLAEEMRNRPAPAGFTEQAGGEEIAGVTEAGWLEWFDTYAAKAQPGTRADLRTLVAAAFSRIRSEDCPGCFRHGAGVLHRRIRSEGGGEKRPIPEFTTEEKQALLWLKTNTDWFGYGSPLLSLVRKLFDAVQVGNIEGGEHEA